MFKRMYLEITNVCNLRCAFCPGTQRPRRFMTPEEFRQLATRLRPYGTYLMLHVMGEPLLHPQLAELLDIAGALGFRVCLVTNGTLLPRQLPTLEGSPALHKLSVSLHSFEGNGRQDAAAPYLEGVWQAAQRLSSRGVLCALRLWNGGGLDRRNGEILTFLSEKLGRDVTALPTDRVGNRRLGEGLFLEPGGAVRLAGSGGSGQRHGVLPRPAESDRRAVRRHGGSLLSGQRGAAGTGKPAPAGAGGDTGLPTGHSHGDGLFPAAAVGGAVPPLRLRCTVQPMRGIGRMIGAIWKNRS